jgi:hypothetical protein
MAAALSTIPQFRGASATTTPRMMGAGRNMPNCGAGTPLDLQIRDASRPAGLLTAYLRPVGALSQELARVTQKAPDLSALAAATRVAADDALADAARTDHLVHLCGDDAGQCLRGMADATRAHAEDLDRGAVFLGRCAAVPGLPALISAIEAGTTFVPTSATSVRSVVILGQDEAANRAPLAIRVAAGLRRRLGRGA